MALTTQEVGAVTVDQVAVEAINVLNNEKACGALRKPFHYYL